MARTEHRLVDVEMGSAWCRGQAVVAFREIAGVAGRNPKVEVVEEVLRGRCLDLLHAAVGA